MGQELAVSELTTSNLRERVCQIVELWGMGEPLDEDRIVEIAWNLYGATREDVREALISNMRAGRLRGSFSAESVDSTTASVNPSLG